MGEHGARGSASGARREDDVRITITPKPHDAHHECVICGSLTHDLWTVYGPDWRNLKQELCLKCAIIRCALDGHIGVTLRALEKYRG